MRGGVERVGEFCIQALSTIQRVLLQGANTQIPIVLAIWLKQCRLKAQYDDMQLQALLIGRMPWATALVNWHARFQLLGEVVCSIPSDAEPPNIHDLTKPIIPVLANEPRRQSWPPILTTGSDRWVWAQTWASNLKVKPERQNLNVKPGRRPSSQPCTVVPSANTYGSAWTSPRHAELKWYTFLAVHLGYTWSQFEKSLSLAVVSIPSSTSSVTFRFSSTRVRAVDRVEQEGFGYNPAFSLLFSSSTRSIFTVGVASPLSDSLMRVVQDLHPLGKLFVI